MVHHVVTVAREKRVLLSKKNAGTGTDASPALSLPPSFADSRPVLIRLVFAWAVSATPPSIVIVAPVLGGPECVRVVLSSSSLCQFWRRKHP